jgi:hypothetical protein
LVLSPVVWSVGQEYAFSEQVQAGAAEHLAFEHLDPVDVALDGPGTIGQGEASAHRVEVAAQVAGEGGQRREGVVFDAVIEASRRSPWWPVIIAAKARTWRVSGLRSGSRRRMPRSLAASRRSRSSGGS